MNTPPLGAQIWLVTGFTDLRQGRHKLAGLVRSRLPGAPLRDNCFVFCNRAESQIRSIWWDAKHRLNCHSVETSHGGVIWPRADEGCMQLTRAEIELLMDGADWRARPVRAPAPARGVVTPRVHSMPL